MKLKVGNTYKVKDPVKTNIDYVLIVDYGQNKTFEDYQYAGVEFYNKKFCDNNDNEYGHYKTNFYKENGKSSIDDENFPGIYDLVEEYKKDCIINKFCSSKLPKNYSISGKVKK